MNIPVTIQWPSTIPLPFYEFSGGPSHSTIFTTLESAVTSRRSRTRHSNDVLSVLWVLGVSEYQNFRVFFQETLGNGAAAFQISLRFPKNSALTEWLVRFAGDGYYTRCLNGRWGISSSLILIDKIALSSEVLAKTGWEAFYAAPEESGGEQDVFITSDDYEFYTQEE